MNNGKSVEKSGRTVDEAIQAALNELNIDLEDADIDIIEEGSKAVWGLFGGKEAKVKVTENKPDTKVVREFLEKILNTMQMEATINIDFDEESINAQVFGDDVAFLIGRYGNTLLAINYLCNLVVNKDKETYKRVVIDVENYRKKREESLRALANRTASRVIKYRRPVSLEPMPAFERRIIHTELQENQYVETISQGEEPNRNVVVKLKPNVQLRENRYNNHNNNNNNNRGSSYKKRY